MVKHKEDSSDDNADINSKSKMLSGKKYNFIKKIMKKCNSTDLMVYCKNTSSKKMRDTWESIFRNTPNLNNIVSAAGKRRKHRDEGYTDMGADSAKR